jgi:hypothetical protein
VQQPHGRYRRQYPACHHVARGIGVKMMITTPRIEAGASIVSICLALNL